HAVTSSLMPSPLETTIPPDGVSLWSWCRSRAPPRLLCIPVHVPIEHSPIKETYMIKRFAVKLFPVAFLLVASPIFAQTPCYQVNGPGPVTLRFECLTSSPGSSSNFTWYGPSQDSMCSYSAPNGLYKSDG